MRAAGYIRVSSASQVEGHSLDAQERLFRELCKNRGWDPVILYREEGRSARYDSIRKRPAFRRLLEDASRDMFDVVVVHTLDRWARNLRVALEAIGILSRHKVALVSITENLDYSTPQGKLMLNMLGSFAEFYSDSLGVHVRKGQDERAQAGKHTGGIPFGYESCYVKEHGVRTQTCDPEHPGGVHIHPKEGPVVAELFKRYASGTTSTSQLAMWLNELGFRTRNMHSLKGPDGSVKPAEPRLFTNASARVILHNAFYCGFIKHRGKLLSQASETVPPEGDYQVCLLWDADVGPDIQERTPVLPGT